MGFRYPEAAGRGVFKRCNCCDHDWKLRADFLGDRRLGLIGYQANFNELNLGFLLFNHAPCSTTLAVGVGAFMDLYRGPLYSDKATGTPDCPGYCLNKNNLDPCKAKCECAFVREVITILRERYRH